MITRKHLKNIILTTGLLSMSMLSVGCQAQKSILPSYPTMNEPQPIFSRSNCVLEESTRFRQALYEAKKDLNDEACYPSFNQYLDGLLNIASGDPDLLRRKDFSEFLVWSTEKGIISKMQAKEYYNSYFTSSFMSLPDEYNVCSQCRNQEQMEHDMYQELLKKKDGMANACSDKKSYNEARSHYDSLLLFLDATCTACGEG